MNFNIECSLNIELISTFSIQFLNETKSLKSSFMYIHYKQSENLPRLKHKRIQTGLKGDGTKEDDDEIDSYLSINDFQLFAEIFHDGVQKRSLRAISESLCQLFSILSYVDEKSNPSTKILADDSLDYLEKNSSIIDDVIFCLQSQADTNFFVLVLQLCEYLCDSDYFIYEFLEKEGFNCIISHFNEYENEDIILKSIILLGEFSFFERDHQGNFLSFCESLLDQEFIGNFLSFCESLLDQEFSKNLSEIFYYSAFLLKQIIEIITQQIKDFNQQLAESEMTQSFNPTELQNNFERINVFLWNLFTKDKIDSNFLFDFLNTQKVVILSFSLLTDDPYFINVTFPKILQFIPEMTSENESEANYLSLKKIKLYELIKKVYEDYDEDKDDDFVEDYYYYQGDDNEEIFQTKFSYIDPYFGKMIFPWDSLIDSLSSVNKKEVFTSLSLFRSLFHFDKITIETVFDKELFNILMGMIESAPYDFKEQALKVVLSWIKSPACDIYKEPFVDLDFVDLLFDLLDAPDENVNKASKEVIRQIQQLNYNDDDFQNLIDERLQFVNENVDD